ncbi:DNA gyrase C-terminal beta-propeller domain-containing protein [Coxiella-like endosymbiont of Rhipicephalus sanguineus]|uniref:DNA gyrase C-terminal beta-propeller domain-containing protein n=1 Tax=Coxiella-like endosymbiont of Rhipicephalus sanguineus TaxID=1955402 RepID=UPI003557E231
MTTAQGSVKKVTLAEFSQPRMNGKIALALKEGDRLVGVDITDGNKEVMLVTDVAKPFVFMKMKYVK